MGEIGPLPLDPKEDSRVAPPQPCVEVF